MFLCQSISSLGKSERHRTSDEILE
ncbi:hypothetical protein P9112_004536 [Eukaryota sp. TZLM1-RC]